MQKEDYLNIVVTLQTSVVQTMKVIDEGGLGIALVMEGNHLQAIVTDGDIRRHIIAGHSLDSPISDAANKNYVYVNEHVPEYKARKIMTAKSISCLPVVDEQKSILDIFFAAVKPSVNKKPIDIPVVIMAGGKGTRLYPYTKVLPKPLIPIGDKTITELIMDQFLPYAINDFTMIVNHKKNMIKAFFADEKLEYNVSFVEEGKPLGTGGGLGLIKNKIHSTFFMTNCDVLLFEDFSKIVDYHKSKKSIATMVCATKTVTIPYGTIDVDQTGQIVSMVEKPTFSFLTNTGFYVFEPEFLNYIPDNQFIHITDIIQSCVDNGETVSMYPISENQWSDMGQLEEMERMGKRLGVI